MRKVKEKPSEDKNPFTFRLNPEKAFNYRFMLESLLRRLGPTKSNLSFLLKKNATHPIIAGIDPKTWNVGFKVKEELGFKLGSKLLAYLQKRNIIDPVSEVLRATDFHEMGHWRFPKGRKFGCPFDNATYYSSFIEPIYEELVNSGKFSEKFCKRMAKRIANAVSDVIDNFNVQRVLTEMGDSFSGQMLFWFLQGQNIGQYSEEYDMFVRLNVDLIGDGDDMDLLQRFMTESEEVEEAVSRLRKIFTEGAMYDMESWEALSREYVIEVIQFLDEEEPPQHQYSAGDMSSEPKEGDEGQKSQGKGKDEDGDQEKRKNKGDEEQGEYGGEEHEDLEEDGGEGQSEDDLGKELTREDMEKIMLGRKAGRGVPFYLDVQEALEAYYRGLAKRIPLKAHGDQPKADFPCVPGTYERYDPERHSVSDITANKLYFDPVQRRLVPSVVKTRLPVDIPVRKDKGQLPDFMFVFLDSSGSMMDIYGGGEKSIVPWGNQSYYHFGLITFHGLLRFFESERILGKMEVDGAIFSSETLTAKGLDAVIKLLLNPTTGGTSIDIKKVMEAMQGKEGVIFPMISDGEIGNWDEVKDEFIELAKKNQFFLIQIGGESEASRDLEAAGLIVKYVDGYKDIAKLTIDLTADRYYAAIRTKLQREVEKYKSLGESG